MKLWHTLALVVVAFALGTFVDWRGCRSGPAGGSDSTVTVTPTPVQPPAVSPVVVPTVPVPGDSSGARKVRELEAKVIAGRTEIEGLREALTDAESTIVSLSQVRKTDILLPMSDSSGFYMVLRADITYTPSCGNVEAWPVIDSLSYPTRTVTIYHTETESDGFWEDATEIGVGVLAGAAIVGTVVAIKQAGR